MTTGIDQFYMLPWPRYVLALARLRQLIADGIPLVFQDSTMTGDKYTRCTWGLCSRDMVAWPDAKDNLWHWGYANPKYRTWKQKCPWEDRLECDTSAEIMKMKGCFYRCRIFQNKDAPTREEALERYDRAMEDANIHDEVEL
jgi:hypothetical protein